MGDQERDKSDRCRRDDADAVAMKAFEDQAQQHRAPTDEYGRRIKIGHGRPTLQHHAKNQAGGMDDKGQNNQVKCRFSQIIRHVEPTTTGQNEGEQIEDNALAKWGIAVEEVFPAALLHFCGKRMFQMDAKAIDNMIECARVAATIGGYQVCIGGDFGGHAIREGGVDQAGPDIGPSLPVGAIR